MSNNVIYIVGMWVTPVDAYLRQRRRYTLQPSVRLLQVNKTYEHFSAGLAVLQLEYNVVSPGHSLAEKTSAEFSARPRSFSFGEQIIEEELGSQLEATMGPARLPTIIFHIITYVEQPTLSGTYQFAAYATTYVPIFVSSSPKRGSESFYIK